MEVARGSMQDPATALSPMAGQKTRGFAPATSSFNANQSGDPGLFSTAAATTSAQQGPIGALSPPVVSVPKAGGAISSMGEKFGVNSSLGTCGLSIPIPTPSTGARGGVEPSLSLNYSSGNGNAIFGYGWDLGIGAITRKTDDGIPQYGCKDTFVMGGAEDLVPLRIYDTTTGTWKVAPKIETTVDAVRYSVQRFRPRIEGSFSSIELWSHISDANNPTAYSYWRIVAPGNRISFYGKTSESRIADPQNPSRIFSWLLCEVRDSRGSMMVVNYKPEDSQGISQNEAMPLNERNRTESIRSANRYPKSIKYGNRVSTLSANAGQAQAHPWFFEVVFDYGEHDKENPRPGDSASWLVRKDPFSTHRSGFEIRTYRLCQRILIFHHFPEKAGVLEDCLVKSLDLTYAADSGSGTQNLGQARGALLEKATTVAYKRNKTGSGYRKQALPPLALDYTKVNSNGGDIQSVEVEGLQDVMIPGSNSSLTFVDLHGDGIPGILVEISTRGSPCWLFKRALGGGRYAEAEYLPNRPSDTILRSSKGAGTSQLIDINGDGVPELVSFDAGLPGFSRTKSFEASLPLTPISSGPSTPKQNGLWEPFVYFDSLPTLDWTSPSTAFVDLTGDGYADVLSTKYQKFDWYQGLEEGGFALADFQDIGQARIDGENPQSVISETGTKARVTFADMTGDGLSDIVRVSNGDISYWPNQGYGRFGAKVSMNNAPRFDYDDLFDPQNIRLVDIYGTGPCDLLYLCRLSSGGTRIYLNESGNSWSAPRTVPAVPDIGSTRWSEIQIVDILGTGTPCLVWTSIGFNTGRGTVHYVDLTGGVKPNMLNSVINNYGSETYVKYASSVSFNLQDRADGRPWLTRLPFPVQVVQSIQHVDRIGKTFHQSRFAYHHGHYDSTAHQREIRGFAMVEQWDTEAFDVLSQEAGSLGVGVNVDDKSSHVPPVYTKTWFHVGAWLGSRGGLDSRYLAEEYWKATSLLDTALLPATIKKEDGAAVAYNLSATELREACRALKGSVLRQEVYGLDDSPSSLNPYSIQESRSFIDLLQPEDDVGTLPAVFLPHGLETVSVQLERMSSLTHARLTHGMTLRTDVFGNVLQSASISYGRRSNNEPSSPPSQADFDKQRQMIVTLQEGNVTNAVGLDISTLSDTRGLPTMYESRNFQLHNVQLPSSKLLYSQSDIASIVTTSAQSAELPYYDTNAISQPAAAVLRRKLKHSKQQFLANDLVTPLPFGTIQSLGIPYQSFTLATTQDQMRRAIVTPGKLAETEMNNIMQQDSKFLRINDEWWIPSGRAFFAPTPAQVELSFAKEHFFLPRRFVNVFDLSISTATSRVTYDEFDLHVVDTSDSLQNHVTAGIRSLQDETQQLLSTSIDYRVLRLSVVMDENGNQTRLAYDTLGLASATAVMGKPNPQDPNAESLEGDSLLNIDGDLDTSTITAFFANPTQPGLAQSILGTASNRTIYDPMRYYQSASASSPLGTVKPSVSATITREVHNSINQSSPVQISLVYSDGAGRAIQTKKLIDPGPLSGETGPPNADPRWLTSGWTIFDNKENTVRSYESFYSATHEFQFGNQVGVSPTTFYDPLGRVVAVLAPDHTWAKSVRGVWHQEMWSQSDTIGIADPRNDPDVGSYFRRLPVPSGSSPGTPSPLFWPTWATSRLNGGMGPEEKKAAENAMICADTKDTVYTDATGSGFVSVKINRSKRSDGSFQDEQVIIRSETDVEGNLIKIIDPLDRVVLKNEYDMAGHALRSQSMESGGRWAIADVSGELLHSWNERDHFSSTFDQMRRLVDSRLHKSGGSILVLGRTEYGEAEAFQSAIQRNVRGRPVRAYDQAGLVTTSACDFKGNATKLARKVAKEYKQDIDWTSPGSVPMLQANYEFEMIFDALNRATSVSLPDNARVQTSYDSCSRVSKVAARLSASDPMLDYLQSVTHNAKGQRTSLQYGNGTKMSCHYDPFTQQVRKLLHTRSAADFPNDNPATPPAGWSGSQIQNLNFFYDPVGNISGIRDDAQQSIFFNGTKVDPSQSFAYDTLGRLVQASGREHLSAVYDEYDAAVTGLAHPNDGTKMRSYTEEYTYDKVDNILSLKHGSGSSTAWTRGYTYNEPSSIDGTQHSNKLTTTTIGSTSSSYGYDTLGNMTAMPHLSSMTWDFQSRLRLTSRQKVGSANTPETTYYTYGNSNMRVRKVTERFASGSATPTIKSQRIYIGCLEFYEEFSGSTTDVETSPPTKQIKTMHVRDGTHKIGILERDSTKNVLNSRYQLSNHIGSCSIELDAQSRVISYEEYTPFGSTSYQATSTIVETPKRYRYIGSERDEENGMCYNAARYYMPWLGRWSTVDPGGVRDGLNLYAYSRNNPVNLSDPGGMDSSKEPTTTTIRKDIAGEPFKGPDAKNPDKEVTSRDEIVRRANEAGIGVSGGMHWEGNEPYFEHIWTISKDHPANDTSFDRQTPVKQEVMSVQPVTEEEQTFTPAEDVSKNNDPPETQSKPGENASEMPSESHLQGNKETPEPDPIRTTPISPKPSPAPIKPSQPAAAPSPPDKPADAWSTFKDSGDYIGFVATKGFWSIAHNSALYERALEGIGNAARAATSQTGKAVTQALVKGAEYTMNNAGKIAKVAGVVGKSIPYVTTAIVAVSAAHSINAAPSGDKGRVASKEAGEAVAGILAGIEIEALVGAAAPVVLAGGPLAWVVGGLTLVAVVGIIWASQKAGGAAGISVYNAANRFDQDRK